MCLVALPLGAQAAAVRCTRGWEGRQAGRTGFGRGSLWARSAGHGTASACAQLCLPGGKNLEKQSAYWPAASVPCSPWVGAKRGLGLPAQGTALSVHKACIRSQPVFWLTCSPAHLPNLHGQGTLPSSLGLPCACLVLPARPLLTSRSKPCHSPRGPPAIQDQCRRCCSGT